MADYNHFMIQFVGSHATIDPISGSDIENYYSAGQGITVTITPDKGYVFNNTLGTYYKSNSTKNNVSPTSFTATTPNAFKLEIPDSYLRKLSNTEKTYLNIDITPIEGVSNVNFYKQNLVNCSSDYTSETLPSGNTVITYTANPNFEFKTAGSCIVENEADGTQQTIPLNLVDSTHQTLTLNLAEPTVNSVYSVDLTADALPLGKTILKLFLTNCSSVKEQDGYIIPSGSNSFKFITTDRNFTFSDNGSVVLTNTDTNTVVSTDSANILDSHNAIVNFNHTQDTSNYELAITLNATGSDPTYTGTVKLDLNNCTADILDNTSINSKTTVTLTADDGYNFTKNGILTIDGSPYQAPYTKPITVTGLTTTTVIIDAADISFNTIFTINMEATLPTKVTSGFSNLYLTNNLELAKLSTERIYTPSNGNNAQSVYKLFDYGSFISNLISIPFDIPTEMLEDSKLILGDKTTDISSKSLLNNILDINIGSIKIDPVYNNSLDYINTKAFIYLPFLNRIPIDVSYIMDHTISIHYIIDLYTGQATINVNDETDNIYTAIAQLGSDLPFIQLSNDKSSLSQKMTILNKIDQAYIMLLRNRPIENFHYPTLETDTLNHYNGYVKVSNITIDDDIDSDEKQQILSLLQNGVVINA